MTKCATRRYLKNPLKSDQRGLQWLNFTGEKMEMIFDDGQSTDISGDNMTATFQDPSSESGDGEVDSEGGEEVVAEEPVDDVEGGGDEAGAPADYVAPEEQVDGGADSPDGAVMGPELPQEEGAAGAEGE